MRRNPRIIFYICLLALLLAALGSLALGASFLPVQEFIRVIAENDRNAPAYAILVHIRFPRLLGAMLAGSALAGAGTVLQKMLLNPLAAPSVIGINSGAGFFALSAMLLFPSMLLAAPVGAFLGALLAAMLVYALSAIAGNSKASIILSGVALSALLGACSDALVTLFPDAIFSRSLFSIGGFESISFQQIKGVLPFWLLGLMLPFFFSKELSLLSLGDESAQSMGLRIKLFRLVFLSAAALLSASAVSLSGLIGFVGLMAPHMARLLLPRHPARHFSLSLLLGALLCVGCDLIARLLFAPYELPVGIVLSFLGAPFFLFLLLSKKRRNAA